jgi:hypothetical protein
MYAQNHDRRGIVRALRNFGCSCREAWSEAVSVRPMIPLEKRVVDSYQVIGQELLGPEWWTEYGRAVLDKVTDRNDHSAL